jgi:Tol biopolymer transport system component/DNA-binding winged helix-turn-helix (wHTH) protein
MAMSTQPLPTPQFQFGPFEFDPASGELRKHRVRVRLHGQPSQLLCYLLNHSDRVVGREEFQRLLWPGAVSGDFDHGLNAAMNKLRQALGDSADQPRYIETLPGRGYRWIAPIQTQRRVLEIARPIAPQPAPPPRDQKWWSLDLRWAALGALMLLLAAITFGMRARQTDPKHDSKPAPPIRFTIAAPPGWYLQGAGNRQSFALSPDGTKLAFTAMDTSGEFRVFLRDLQEMQATTVPDSAAANTVFWHPDGGSLLFTSRGVLRRYPVGSTTTQTIGDSIPGLLSAIWPSPDRMILTNRLVNASIPASGGTIAREKQTYAWPQILSGGRNVLHVVFDEKVGRHRARVSFLNDGSSEGGTLRELVETDSKVVYAAPGYLLYVRAGVLLALPFNLAELRATGQAVPLAEKVCSFLPTASADFSVSDTGTLVYQPCIPRSQLVWVDRKGKQIGEASLPGLALKAARISPDGKRIATSVFDYERGVSDVWLFERNGTAGRKMTGPGLSHSPVWSPDGTQLILARAFETSPKLFLRSLEGQEVEEPLPRADFQLPTDWSPDGRFVAYNNTGTPLTQNEQHGDIWAVDLERGRRLVPLIVTRHHEANAAFSPDGEWIAFTSNESGRPELYIQKLERGDSLQVVGPRHVVSRHGAQALRWRADGRELFYLGADGTIYAVALRRGSSPELDTPQPLFQISAEARAAVHAVLGFDVSADGKRFVIPVVNSLEKPPLIAVQNWTGLLGRAR